MFVTYIAPPKDERVVEFMGVEFFSGQALDLDPIEYADVIAKATKNPCFKVEADVEDNNGPVDEGSAADGGDGSDGSPKRRGRKPGSRNLPKPASGTPE